MAPSGKKKVKSMAYYDLLGVEADATPEQLKKAYRKKALQLHPDKRGNTPEAQEEFTRMKSAYDVLNDPQKREVYDQAGEDGVKLMENYASMGSEELLAAFFASLGAIGSQGKCLLMLGISLLFGFFLIIPIFWCLRVDQTISWSWVAVFTPLWVLDAIIYCCLGCMSFSSRADLDPEDQAQKKPMLAKIYKFLKALLLLVLQIFVAMKLNGDLNWSVREVLLPYYVYDALSFFEAIIAGFVGDRLLTKDSQGAGVTMTESIQKQRVALLVATLVRLVLIAARLAQGALIGLKVDHQLGGASWWVVFTPVWIYIGYYVVATVFRYFKARAKSKDKAANKPKEQQSSHDAYTRDSVHEDENDEPSKSPLMDAFCTVLFIGVITSPYFILATRLQDGSFSTIYILLPWFIIVGLVLCFILCTIGCVGNLAAEHEAAQNNAHDVRSPTGDDEGARSDPDYMEVEDKA